MKREIYLPRECLPQTPDPVTVTTGDQHIIEQTRDKFFDEVLNYLGITERARQIFSERISHALSIENFEKITALFQGEEMSVRRGEDYLCLLIVRELPVAGTVIRRDISNYIQGVFYHNLTPACETAVRGSLVPFSGGKYNVNYREASEGGLLY